MCKLLPQVHVVGVASRSGVLVSQKASLCPNASIGLVVSQLEASFSWASFMARWRDDERVKVMSEAACWSLTYLSCLLVALSESHSSLMWVGMVEWCCRILLPVRRECCSLQRDELHHVMC